MMRILLGFLLSLFIVPAYATPLETGCLDVVSVVECNTDAAMDLSSNCRDADLFGDGVYSVQTNPGLSSNLFSHITLRVGTRTVRGCDRGAHGGVVCALAPDLAGVFRLHVIEAGAFRRNLPDCRKDFTIQLPLTPRTSTEE